MNERQYDQKETKDVSTTFVMHTEWAKSDSKGPNADNRQLQMQFMGYRNIMLTICKQSMTDGKFTERQTVLIPDGGDILGVMTLFTKASISIKNHIASKVAKGEDFSGTIFAKSHILRTGNVVEVKVEAISAKEWTTKLFIYRKNKETGDVFLIGDFTFPSGSVIGASADELMLDTIGNNIRAMVYGTSAIHAAHVVKQSAMSGNGNGQKPTSAPTSYESDYNGASDEEWE
ncbi:MAG: hypothetical protein ACRCX2_15635 [Paraclostridium sp.]